MKRDEGFAGKEVFGTRKYLESDEKLLSFAQVTATGRAALDTKWKSKKGYRNKWIESPDYFLRSTRQPLRQTAAMSEILGTRHCPYFRM